MTWRRGVDRSILAAICAMLLLAGPGHAQVAPVDPESGDTAGPDAPVKPKGENIFSNEGPGLFSNGYYRFGVGATDGDDMVAFRLNGAESKYRLGNESDLYSEFSLGYRLPLDNGSNAIGEVMVNGSGNSNALVFGAPFDGGGDVVQA